MIKNLNGINAFINSGLFDRRIETPQGAVVFRSEIDTLSGGWTPLSKSIADTGLIDHQSFSPAVRVLAPFEYEAEPSFGALTVAPSEIAAGNPDPLDSLIAPEWGNVTPDANGRVYVYFAPAGEDFGEDLPSYGWSAHDKAQVMLALMEFEKILGFTYEITTNENQASFRLIAGNADGSLGYFYPIQGGPQDGVGNFNIGTGGNAGFWGNAGQVSLDKGGYSWITLIHEFGHGHGLDHPHDASGGSVKMEGVTSDFDDYGDFNLNQGVYTVMSYNDAWQLHPAGPSPYSAATAGYGWTGTLSALDIGALQERYGIINPWATGDDIYVLQDSNAIGTYYETIWDTGGTDVIRYGGSRDALIDLTAATLDYSESGGGVISYVDGIKGGYTIANLVVIENAKSGAGNDTLIGNSAANILSSRGGVDLLDGKGGDDTLVGGNGNDSLLGGWGKDRLLGGGGDDTLLGQDNDDHLSGGAGMDDLQGGAGDDLLFDKQGGDTLNGGTGDDKYIVFTDTNLIIEGGGGGVDAIRTKADYTLPDKVENLTMLGGLDLSATGNGQNNEMTGNSGDNSLNGRSGDDLLAGRAGGDELEGRAGNDTLRGDRGADTLDGGTGDDVLFGDKGLDRLTGGAGADTFTFLDDSQFDTITDFEDGIDRIKMSDYRQENGGSRLTIDQLLITQNGADTVIQLDLDMNGIADVIDLDGDATGDGWSVTLLDTDAATITAADFIF